MHDNQRESEPAVCQRFILSSLGILAFLSLSLVAGSKIVAQVAPNASAQTRQTVPGEKEIPFTVTVLNDKGGYICGLKKESFSVIANKTPQEVAQLACMDVPLSVGVLIDMSGSMNNSRNKSLSAKRLSMIRDGVARFVSLSNKEDEYFLVGFADQAQLLVDTTREGNAITDMIPSLELKGHTAFYDACYLGVEKAARGAHEKRVVILVSDGNDNMSTRKPKELERLLRETGVLLYCVSVAGIKENPFGPGWQSLPLTGPADLGKLAKQTGGLAFFPTESNQIQAVFEMIAIELRNQYRVVIRPTPSEKREQWQSLEIKVTPPASGSAELKRLTVRSREGFYSAAGPR